MCINQLIRSLVTEKQGDTLKLQCANLETKLFDMTKALKRLETELSLKEKDRFYKEFDDLTQENTEALKLANNKLKEIAKGQERSCSGPSYKSSHREFSTTSSRNSYYESFSSRSNKHSRQLSHHSSRRSHNSQKTGSPTYKLSSKYSRSRSSSSKPNFSSLQTKHETDIEEKVASLEKKIDLIKSQHNIQEKY